MTDTVELTCGVYGEGAYLAVTVPHDATVHQVKEAIWSERCYGNKYKIGASELTLYSTRKDGEWVDTIKTNMTFLNRAIDTVFEKLDPLWRNRRSPVHWVDPRPHQRQLADLGGIARDRDI